MKLEGTTLVVCEGQYEDDGRVVDAPFEIMDVSSGSINRMLLSMMACDDTLGHMHYLIHMILLDTGIVKNVEEVQVDAKPGPKSWTLLRPEGHVTPVLTSTSYAHAVWRLTTYGGSKWAFDISAAQYGFDDGLLPWFQYEAERVLVVRQVQPYGTYQEAVSAALMRCDASSPLVAEQNYVAKKLRQVIRHGFENTKVSPFSPKKLVREVSNKQFKWQALSVIIHAFMGLESMKRRVVKKGWSETLWDEVRAQERMMESGYVDLQSGIWYPQVPGDDDEGDETEV